MKERLRIQRKKKIGTGDHDTLPESVHETLAAGGAPLDSTTRTTMEPRFGHDFSQVRVHTDGPAADSAEALNARAYTVGQDLVFGAGEYAPGSSDGQHLLAHELTHVVQQSSGPVSGSLMTSGVSISQPSDGFEQAADQAAAQVMAGQSVDASAIAGGSSATPAVQREEDEELAEEVTEAPAEAALPEGAPVELAELEEEEPE